MLSSSLSSGVSNSTSPYMGESPLQPLPPLFVPSVVPSDSRPYGVDLRGTNETGKFSELGSYFSPTEVLEQYQEFIDYITQNYGIVGYTTGNMLNFHKKVYTLEFQKKILGLISEYLKTQKEKDYFFFSLLNMVISTLYKYYQFGNIDESLIALFGRLLKALLIDNAQGNDDDINAIVLEANQIFFFDTVDNNNFKTHILDVAALIIKFRSIYRSARGYRPPAMFGNGLRKKGHSKYTKKMSLRKKRRKLKKRKTRKPRK
jgi:hypothetical protein